MQAFEYSKHVESMLTCLLLVGILFATSVAVPASPKHQDVKEHMVQVTQQLNALQQNMEDPRAPSSELDLRNLHSRFCWTESGQTELGGSTYWMRVQTSKPGPELSMRS